MEPKVRSLQTTGPKNVPVAALDTDAWLGRALYYDVFALAVCLLSGAAFALDLYSSGYVRGMPGVATSASFGPLARLAIEGTLYVASFAWIAARLVLASLRSIPRLR